MNKNAPSLGRILTMVLFAFSCFGLLLFLWLSFGGPIPLKPQGYRFEAAFPEASTLAEEADVRISGVNVGKVKSKELDTGANRTIVTMDLNEEFSPIPSDTRAILRQKTLLGETYVELSPGNTAAPKLPENGTLLSTNVEPTVELDEILRIFNPRTKEALRNFTAEFAKVTKGSYAEDLNDAFGNLAGTATEGADVLGVLEDQEQSLRDFVRNTGVTFGALSERQGALQALVTNSNQVFEATAQEQDALAETFRIFPTFLRESRTTLARAQEFSANTHPLVRDLGPVADDLGPTVRDLGDLSPDLEALFKELNPLIDASETGLPAAERVLRGARPLFRGLHQFLPELNPIFAYANYGQVQLAQFLTSGGLAIIPGDNPRRGPHGALPQFAITDGRSLQLAGKEGEYFRGNAYPAPNYLRRARAYGAFESFSCDNAGGEQVDPQGEAGMDSAAPPCFVAPNDLFSNSRFPRVTGGNKVNDGIFQNKRPPAFSPSPRKNDARSCAGPPSGSVGKGSRNPIRLCSERRSAPRRISGSQRAP